MVLYCCAGFTFKITIVLCPELFKQQNYHGENISILACFIWPWPLPFCAASLSSPCRLAVLFALLAYCWPISRKRSARMALLRRKDTYRRLFMARRRLPATAGFAAAAGMWYGLFMAASLLRFACPCLLARRYYCRLLPPRRRRRLLPPG